MGGDNISGDTNKVLVIGSIGMDQITFLSEIPKFGETTRGRIKTSPGGKGNNQAIACARAGGETTFVGVVGDDYDKILKKTLEDNNITPVLKVLKNIPSHIASILIETNGANKVIYQPGADDYLDINLIDKNIHLIEKAYIILLQLEIPLKTVEYIINICYEKEKIIILKPSPGIELSKNIIQKVNYLIPNKSELSIISGLPTNDEHQIDFACQKIMEMGAQNLIVTLGQKGCILWNQDGRKEYSFYIKDIEGKVVDTTGLSGCFIGVLAAYLSNKSTLDEAIKYANLAASISVNNFGAIDSYPNLGEINEKRQKIKNW